MSKFKPGDAVRSPLEHHLEDEVTDEPVVIPMGATVIVTEPLHGIGTNVESGQVSEYFSATYEGHTLLLLYEDFHKLSS